MRVRVGLGLGVAERAGCERGADEVGQHQWHAELVARLAHRLRLAPHLQNRRRGVGASAGQTRRVGAA